MSVSVMMVYNQLDQCNVMKTLVNVRKEYALHETLKLVGEEFHKWCRVRWLLIQKIWNLDPYLVPYFNIDFRKK